MKKIYDGDVKARVDVAIENYKAKKNCYFNDEMHNYSQELRILPSCTKSQVGKQLRS